MQNTLPPEARLSNGYGLEDSTHAQDALRRFDSALATKAATHKNTRILKGLAATTLVGGGALAYDALHSHSSADTVSPPAAHAAPSPDTTVSHPGEPLTITAQKGDVLENYAKAIEAQPGNNDRTVAGITEDLIDLNGNTAAIDATQAVSLPSYARDMEPDRPGTQLTPAQKQ